MEWGCGMHSIISYCNGTPAEHMLRVSGGDDLELILCRMCGAVGKVFFRNTCVGGLRDGAVGRSVSSDISEHNLLITVESRLGALRRMGNLYIRDAPIMSLASSNVSRSPAPVPSDEVVTVGHPLSLPGSSAPTSSSTVESRTSSAPPKFIYPGDAPQLIGNEFHVYQITGEVIYASIGSFWSILSRSGRLIPDCYYRAASKKRS